MTPYIPDELPLQSLDWTKFISLIGSANAELARYDATLQAIVNPHVLLSPLTTQEAVLSSKIEGTRTSLEEVLQYDASQEVAPERQSDMHEVLNYRRAMREAIEYMKNRPVCLDLVLKIQGTLLEGVRGQEVGRGELRKVQNCIGSPGSTMKTRVPEAIATQFTVQTIDALFDRPIFRTTDFVTRTGISKRKAMRILAAVEESNVADRGFASQRPPGSDSGL